MLSSIFCIWFRYLTARIWVIIFWVNEATILKMDCISFQIEYFLDWSIINLLYKFLEFNLRPKTKRDKCYIVRNYSDSVNNYKYHHQTHYVTIIVKLQMTCISDIVLLFGIYIGEYVSNVVRRYQWHMCRVCVCVAKRYIRKCNRYGWCRSVRVAIVYMAAQFALLIFINLEWQYCGNSSLTYTIVCIYLCRYV